MRASLGFSAARRTSLYTHPHPTPPPQASATGVAWKMLPIRGALFARGAVLRSPPRFRSLGRLPKPRQGFAQRGVQNASIPARPAKKHWLESKSARNKATFAWILLGGTAGAVVTIGQYMHNGYHINPGVAKALELLEQTPLGIAGPITRGESAPVLRPHQLLPPFKTPPFWLRRVVYDW